MKNKVIIHNPEVKNKKHLSCKISTTVGIRKFFYDNHFFAEYNREIDKVHPSILSIPIMANVIPIAWLYDAEVVIESLDVTFYKCIEEIKNIFRKMYPNLDWRGSILCEHLKQNEHLTDGKSAMLFSGGIDSYFSFISNKDEKPGLITVWGADIQLFNNKLFNQLRSNIQNFATANRIDSMIIKTNFTEFINQHILCSHFYGKLPFSWYVSIQHGMGLLGLCAPLAMAGNIQRIYISSTYSSKFSIPCGSSPLVDNKVRWSNVKVLHDAFEYERIEKVKALAEFMKEEKDNIKFRVCLSDQKEYNCSICQKCLRTITEMMSVGLNPNGHGFIVTGDTLALIKNRIIEGRMIVDISKLYFWNSVKESIDLDRIYRMEGSLDFFEWLKNISLEDYLIINKDINKIILRKAIKYFYPIFNFVYRIFSKKFLYRLYFKFLNKQNMKYLTIDQD